MASKGVTKSGEAFCMACGAGVEAGSSRCESCYSGLDEQVLAFRCPRCGKVLELGTAQCPDCSMKFKVKAVRPSDPAEDEKMVTRLIDWGRSSRGEKAEQETAPASELTEGGGDSLEEREERLRKREEMVDRKIKAYAQKKKELEMRQAELRGDAGGQEAPGQGATHHELERLARRVRSVHELVSLEGACDDLEACLSSLEERLRGMVVSQSELEQNIAQLKEGEDEVRTLLKVLDGLLGQLPTEVVERFSKSDEFKLYERVLDRLKI